MTREEVAGVGRWGGGPSAQWSPTVRAEKRCTLPMRQPTAVGSPQWSPVVRTGKRATRNYSD